MPKGLRAASYWTRLLRVVASFVEAMPRPACSCPFGSAHYSGSSHSSLCLRFLHVRIVALLQTHDLDPYRSTHELAQALEELEDGGTKGGARAFWRGGGMDPTVLDWIGGEIEKSRTRAAHARKHGEATTAHAARVKALKNVRTALRRYAEDGTQITEPRTHR